jgi:hypothetical protein
MPRTISAILTVILGIGLIAEVRAQERSSETSIISASRGSVEGGYRLSAGNPVSVLRPDERASTFRAQSSEPQAAGGGTAYLVPAQLPAEPLPAQGEASGYVVPTQPTALPAYQADPPAALQLPSAQALPTTVTGPQLSPGNSLTAEPAPPYLPASDAPIIRPLDNYDDVRSLPPGGLSPVMPAGSINSSVAGSALLGGATTAVSQAPDIVVETIGPPLLQVGSAARWQVRVTNRDNRSCGPVFLRTELPSWMELSDSKVSAGDIDRGEFKGESRLITWQLPGLPAGGVQHWTLTLVPQQNKSFDFQLEWSIRPSALSTPVRVVQPELNLDIDGPAEMVLGQTRLYTIRLSNPGNGAAHNVSVQLEPGNARQVIGTLAAGETRRMEIELNADRAGQLQITAFASGQGLQTVQSKQEVLVRRPELVVTVQGPESCFAGEPARYRVEIFNRGDAVAEDTAVHATLPLGARLLGGDSNRRDNTIAWSIGDVAPGARRAFQFECLYSRAGNHPLHVRLSGNGVDPTADSVTTRVQGIADLKLLVNDPQGPQRLSQLAVYELQIVNRGTRAARNVSVVGQFGHGVEPVKVVGGEAELVPGQVLFAPIAVIQPGERVTLKIHAQANTVGRHKFRVLVQSEAPQTQLVQEEMTWFVSEVATAAASRER